MGWCKDLPPAPCLQADSWESECECGLTAITERSLNALQKGCFQQVFIYVQAAISWSAHIDYICGKIQHLFPEDIEVSSEPILPHLLFTKCIVLHSMELLLVIRAAPIQYFNYRHDSDISTFYIGQYDIIPTLACYK